MRNELPDCVQKYVDAVTNAAPSIAEVWLVGSRANGRATEASDWDFMVFADQQALMLLRVNTSLACEDIDVLVVVDGNRFESPWPRLDKPYRFKSGHLKNYLDADGVDVVSWEWSPLGDNEATYTGESFREERAVLIYRRENAA